MTVNEEGTTTMSNPIETRYLLVTLPESTGEEADGVIEFLEDQLTDGFTVSGTVAHAPQLWVVMVDGPEFDRVDIFATEEECYDLLRDHLRDEHEVNVGYMMSDIRRAMERLGYIILIERRDYPVHPASLP